MPVKEEWFCSDKPKTVAAFHIHGDGYKLDSDGLIDASGKMHFVLRLFYGAVYNFWYNPITEIYGNSGLYDHIICK